MYNEEYNINFIKYKKQIKETFKSKINKYTLTQKGKLIFLTSGGGGGRGGRVSNS